MNFTITINVTDATYIDKIEYYWIDGNNIKNRKTKEIEKNISHTYSFWFKSRVPHEFLDNCSFVVEIQNKSAKKDIDVKLLQVTNIKYLKNIENFLLLFIVKYKYIGLFIASIIATTVLPIATDFMVILAIYFNLDLFLVVFVATVGSTIGGYTTFMIGRVFRAYARRKISEEKLKNYDQMFQRFGPFVIFLGSFSPLPFDVVALAAGLLMISSKIFLAFTFLGRFFRYYLMSKYVDFALKSTEGELNSDLVLYTTLGIVILILITILAAIIWKKMGTKKEKN